MQVVEYKGDVTGQVSSIGNHDTGDLSEGSSLYFTAARARGNISVTDNGGDGALSYDSGTGVISYTGPSAAEVRAHISGGYGIDISSGEIATSNSDVRGLFSAGGDLSYNSTTGVFSFTNDAGDIESVTAGNGLTGGGSSGGVTLNVVGGYGITANADDIEIANSEVRALFSASGDISYDSSTGVISFTNDAGDIESVGAGTGMTGGGTSGAVTLNVIGGDGITANANDMAIDLGDTAIFTSTNTASRAIVRDTNGSFAGNVFTGTATQAQYADLAENYEADADYEPGTVLVIGGESEVTISDEVGNYKVVGVVSTDPAHLMNNNCEGDHVVAVALRGRIPCKVTGNVKKGDVLIASNIPGHAMVAAEPHNLSPLQIIGRALANKNEAAEGIVEIIV